MRLLDQTFNQGQLLGFVVLLVPLVALNGLSDQAQQLLFNFG
jgi:hypothetical protein